MNGAFFGKDQKRYTNLDGNRNLRRRIRHSFINRSPVIKPPSPTRYVKQASSIVPSTPLITISLQSQGIGDPPWTQAGIRQKIVEGRTYFEIDIPARSFLDREDGNVRALQLRLNQMRESGKGIWNVDYNQKSTWLGLDESTQILFGVPPDSSTVARSLIGETCSTV